MDNVFDRFYDTEAEVYSVQKGDYETGDTKNYLGKVKGDFQPYTSYASDNAYGLSEDRQFKLYSDKYPIIKVGNLILFMGEWYRIVSVKDWSMGMTAVIKGIDNEN